MRAGGGRAGLAFCCVMAGACGPAYDDEFESCTAEDVPAISITAVDAETGAPVDSLSGLVRDGAYVDSLDVPSVLPGTAYAASERPGTYAVEVRAPGYAPWDTAGVVAPDNGCHVGRRDLRVLLRPVRAGG